MADAEKETILTEETPVDLPVIEDEEKPPVKREEGQADLSAWKPKTSLGKAVKDGKITSMDDAFKTGAILESQIVDALMPGLETDLLLIGQAKGKFGGGQRRAFRQTQKKTMEGNKPKFTTCAVIGNKDGYLGIGFGHSKETVPAREKAMRNAKLSIFKIRRGCGSWQCGCRTPHSIPFKVEGKCGSVKVILKPAPKGKGLVANEEMKKILKLCGIRDIWTRVSGQTTSRMNFVKAYEAALRQLMATKLPAHAVKDLGIVEGTIKDGSIKNE